MIAQIDSDSLRASSRSVRTTEPNELVLVTERLATTGAVLLAALDAWMYELLA